MLLLADLDWTVIISAVGGAAVLVTGAIGREWYKVASARWEAERQARSTTTAAERKEKREVTTELYRLLDIKEQDNHEWRAQVHDLRNEQAVLSQRLSVCEWDRSRLQQMVEDMGEAIQAAGIKVRYRPPPPPPGAVRTHQGSARPSEETKPE